MNGFFKRTGGRIVLCVLVMLLCGGVGGAIWYNEQPKFHDVTVELGAELPEIEDFITDYAIKDWCDFVTPTSSIDMHNVGQQSIILKHAMQKETVILNIVDTIAPNVEFKDVTIHIDDSLTAELFLSRVSDYSETTASFAIEPSKPETFGQDSVTIIVKDTSGNTTQGICSVRYVWIDPHYTLELGEALAKSDLKPYTSDEDVLPKTWVDMINSAGIGTYSFTSCYGNMTCECVVDIVDTTAPEVQVQDLSVFCGDPVAPEDFVVSVFDLSNEFKITSEVEIHTEEIGQKSIQIIVTDSSGNQTVKAAQLSVIADTEGPVIAGAESIRIEQGATFDYTAGITVSDNRDEDVTISYDASTVNQNVLGTYYVTYVAEDRAGNRTEVIREVVVTEDSVPPVFSGLSEMSVAKNSSPNFTKGVSATDTRDGSVEYTYDTSGLDLTKAGTYYITYTATDKAGNQTTAKRKVFVNYDSSDVDLLVADIAATLSDDPETIRDYVRSTIGYNRYWGGDNPVWYGFKNKVGNCYVHALCLQALFNEKGIENMLIWDTDRSHYWNLVKIDGQWKHIDSTPSRPHTTYSLMNDKQRYESLISGNWDRSQWPACN